LKAQSQTLSMFTFKRALCALNVAVSGFNVLSPRGKMDSVANDLKGLTSCEAVSTTVPERWSTYEAPQPGVVVNAVTEDDVAATVCFLPR
jgi:hypothetical protein